MVAQGLVQSLHPLNEILDLLPRVGPASLSAEVSAAAKGSMRIDRASALFAQAGTGSVWVGHQLFPPTGADSFRSEESLHAGDER
jgi:hypothetical protein